MQVTNAHFSVCIGPHMSNRFTSILNLKQYAKINPPILVGGVSAIPSRESQMVLRMLVEAPYSNGLQLPDELRWLSGVIAQAKAFQHEKIGIAHPFTYVTVRHGLVASEHDDDWHVDGFSVKYNHLPEANYVFTTGTHPTEIARERFVFPKDFDPIKHNIHRFFQHRVREQSVEQLEPNTLYLMDPYVVHRRPPSTSGSERTFVRISFTPIEIPDENNTKNPLIETKHYTTNGVRGFRDHLDDYDASL